MRNVLKSSILVFFILSLSCKNSKYNNVDIASKSIPTDYLRDSLHVVKSESPQITQQDSLEILYKERFADTSTKNTYDIVYKTQRVLRAFDLNFNQFGSILISHSLEDSIGLNYAMEINKPQRVNLTVKSKKVKTFLIYYSDPSEFEINKRGENFYFNIRSNMAVGDSIIMDDHYRIKEAYFIHHGNMTYSKRTMKEKNSIVDFTGDSLYWGYGSAPLKRIIMVLTKYMDTLDLHIQRVV